MKRLGSAAIAVLLILLVVTAFAPCLRNGFVPWDDDKNFQNNPGYRGFGWSQLHWDWTSFQLGVYQPLAWMIFGAEWLLWGLRPWGYHFTSLLLHALNSVALFVLAVSLLIRCRDGRDQAAPAPPALAAGLAVGLFAVHPLRTEVVAWASCQPYLPCALFAMLTVLAYLRAFPEGAPPQRRWLAAAFGLFAAALLCKSAAVGLPAVFVILDVYPLQRFGGGAGRWFGRAVRAVWWENVPFAALSLMFMGLAIAGRVKERDLVSIHDWGIAARFAQACYAIGFYPLKTVLPWNLTAYYPMPEQVVWYQLPFVACILGTLGLSVLLYLLRRRWPGLLAAWLSYLAILAPNLGFMRFGDQIAADRYSYIAMMGAVVVLAAGLGRIGSVAAYSWPVAAASTAATFGLLLGLILLSRGQCQTWRTSMTLWTHALSRGASRSFAAHTNLGLALFDEGRLGEARDELSEALRINPRFADAHNNLGLVLKAQGRLEEAGAEFAAALGLNPESAEAHNNRGVLRKAQGQFDEAQADFAAAVRLDPFSAQAHCNLGVLLGRQGRVREARDEFSKALWINPDYADAHNNLGVLLFQRGLIAMARTEFRESLRINPGSSEAHHNLGVLLGQQGRIEEARREFSEALRINPAFAGAQNSLDLLQNAQSQIGAARAQPGNDQ